MAYWRWGPREARHVVVCVHGLTRQGRDFDRLAKALVAQAPHPVQVICPDVAGRGQSEWLTDPAGYQLPQYAGDMLALLGQISSNCRGLQVLAVASKPWIGWAPAWAV